VRRLVQEGEVVACHDIADGGMAVAVAEMAMASGIGVTLDPPDGAGNEVGWLFGEDQGRYLLAVEPECLASILDEAATAGVVARAIGKTGGQSLTLKGCDVICLDKLVQRHEGWLPGYMAAES
jgi:phosphoribosylformylglycinamidine synthase